MKGDFTRLTFAREKHYSSVRMQQGRVQLDADWNEQLDITGHRVETEAGDVIGVCGAPQGDSFKVGLQKDGTLTLHAGRYYVDGILCENEHTCRLAPPATLDLPVQPDLPGATAPSTPGNYIVYLDVWQRHLTAVEDPSLIEVAIDAQTATRTKTVWQAKLLEIPSNEVPPPGNFACGQSFSVWNDLVAWRDARMQAQTVADTSGSGPCIVPAAAGYQRLENQLYRVEIHKPGPVGTATFTWSRDNGSVVSGVDKFDAKTITISDPGRDPYLSFAAGQWVELTDDRRELNPDGASSVLVRLTSPTEGTLLTYDPATASGAINPTAFGSNTKVRRWDQADVDEIATDATTWIPLEGGVQVQFATGDNYVTGDYWLIPARAVTAQTAAGTIEWPTDTKGNPVLQQAAGIRHHYCRLAIFEWGTQTSPLKSVTDCRRLFPPLTELTNLYYAGGDGQETMPDFTAPTSASLLLPQPLRAGVANGDRPVFGATVRFEVGAGGGSLQGGAPGAHADVQTGPDGIATCVWMLTNDTTHPTQWVTAKLVDEAGGTTTGVPILYTANLNVASRLAFDPGNCDRLIVVKNVQDAIDGLCHHALRYLSGDGQEGMVGHTLPCPLMVGVEDETGQPRPNETVTFEATLGSGDVLLVPGTALSGTSINVKTNQEGVAQVSWVLGGQLGCHQVTARFPGPFVGPKRTPLAIPFNAMVGPKLPTILTISWGNDEQLKVRAFNAGISVGCSQPMDPFTVNPTTFIVTAEVADTYMTFPIRRSIILSGVIDSSDTQKFRFVPHPLLDQLVVAKWLEEDRRLFPDSGLPGIRCRVVLKGNFISDGKQGLSLDGNAFGFPVEIKAVVRTPIAFKPPSGDDVKGGDFESWFWLTTDG